MHGGKVSERLFEHGLCLPSGAGMSEEDRNRVIAAVVKAFKR
jgi:dTDP-4-amino-4,6-dideoxygalactose transaminase